MKITNNVVEPCAKEVNDVDAGTVVRYFEEYYVITNECDEDGFVTAVLLRNGSISQFEGSETVIIPNNVELIIS